MAYYATYMPDETGALHRVVINAGVGFCLPFYGTEAPPGTLACDGSEISRTAYKELFAVLGTKAGAGNGSTTFNLPDFRGDFIRCVGGNAAALGVQQGDAIRNISGDTGGYDSYIYRDADTNGVFCTMGNPANMYYCLKTETAKESYRNDWKLLFDASRVVPTAAENRPVNVALLWCIIYE